MIKDINEIISKDKEYYMNVFGCRTPVAFERGEGIYLYDINGVKYTDFFAGIAVNALGHSDQAVVDAVTAQAKKLIHCSNLYYVEAQTKLAELICKISIADKVFFSNSGAEANEAAIKLAREYFKKKGHPEKYGFICLNKSFHGRTITTLAATGQDKYKKPFEPVTPGFKDVNINDLEELKNAVDGNTCAVMLEAVQGESGVHPLDKEYVKNVRKLCDERELLLIFDEVQTGFGRTGCMFGYEYVGADPDIITMAKAIGGGLPLGCVGAKDFVASAFAPGDHGSTFGGGALACSAGYAAVSEIINRKLPENAHRMGEYIFNKLKTDDDLPIKEVRVCGLMVAIEFSSPIAAKVKAELFNRKYLCGNVGNDTLRILPPLIITEEDWDGFMEAMKKAIATVTKENN